MSEMVTITFSINVYWGVSLIYLVKKIFVL